MASAGESAGRREAMAAQKRHARKKQMTLRAKSSLMSLKSAMEARRQTAH
jgi:hypothetical protein